LVDATGHTRIDVICSNFEYIIDCIICAECDLDISTLEKICNLSYFWIVISDSDPFFFGLKVVLLCDGGKISFCVTCVLSFQIIE
jgi:hypothetical protein